MSHAALPTPDAVPISRRTTLLYSLAALLFLGAVFALILGMSMRKAINHDEHQFIASAALIARHGLLPYLDFPYFHFPGLSYLYALVFQFTDRLLLAARSVSVLTSWLMLALLFSAPVLLLRRKPGWQSLLMGALVVLLLASTQTFRYSTGWAWNHDVPVLLMCAACWLQMRLLLDDTRAPRWWLSIGLLLGVAASMRASFALVGIPFALWLLPLPPRRGASWSRLLWLAAGGVLGLAPAWIFLLLAPAEFIFDNLDYVRLNTAHYLATGGLEPGQAWMQKWEMTRDTMIMVWRANFALLLLTGVQLIRLRKQLRAPRAPGAVFLLVVIPFALISAYLPTPMQIQYIYLVFPLLGLLNLALLHRDHMPRLGMALLAVAALYAATQAAQDFRESLQAAFQPSTWVATQVHEHGQTIAQHIHDAAGDDPVITLAPIYPLEGGVNIQPQLASGPFAWRVADLVEPPQRARMGIIGPDEMAAQMSAHPPRAILVGIHGAHAELEPSLEAYARTHGYTPIPIPGFRDEPATLWLAPK